MPWNTLQKEDSNEKASNYYIGSPWSNQVEC